MEKLFKKQICESHDWKIAKKLIKIKKIAELCTVHTILSLDVDAKHRNNLIQTHIKNHNTIGTL